MGPVAKEIQQQRQGKLLQRPTLARQVGAKHAGHSPYLLLTIITLLRIMHLFGHYSSALSYVYISEDAEFKEWIVGQL